MTLKYRYLDPNGDYVFGKNAQAFVSGAAAVSQAILTRLKLLSGEWWEDTAQGLPLFQNILGQVGTPENLAAIDLIIQDKISGTKDVTGIENFESSYTNRKYTVNCTVNTRYGQASVEVAL